MNPEERTYSITYADGHTEEVDGYSWYIDGLAIRIDLAMGYKLYIPTPSIRYFKVCEYASERRGQ